jgi:hypothetical protein
MKRRERSRLDSIGKKRDTVWRRGDIGRRRGSTEKEKRVETTPVELTRILLGQKIKIIHAVNSASTNGR